MITFNTDVFWDPSGKTPAQFYPRFKLRIYANNASHCSQWKVLGIKAYEIVNFAGTWLVNAWISSQGACDEPITMHDHCFYTELNITDNLNWEQF